MWIPFAVLAIALVIVAAPTAVDSRRKSTRAAVERHAKRVNIALTPDVAPRIERRLLRRDRAICAAGLTTVILAVASAPLLPESYRTSFLPVVIMSSTFVGIAVGAAIASLTETLTPLPGPRIARSSTPRYRDYVDPLERWGARSVVTLAVLSIAAAVMAIALGALGDTTLSGPAVLGSAGAAIAAVAVIALVAVELLARTIVSRGQPASSPTELAWDDALRSTTLRDLLAVPLVLGCVSVLTTFLEVGMRTDYRGDGAAAALIGLIALGVLFMVLVSSVIWTLVTKSHQYYWRRLWAPAARSAEGASA